MFYKCMYIHMSYFKRMIIYFSDASPNLPRTFFTTKNFSCWPKCLMKCIKKEFFQPLNSQILVLQACLFFFASGITISFHFLSFYSCYFVLLTRQLLYNFGFLAWLERCIKYHSTYSKVGERNENVGVIRLWKDEWNLYFPWKSCLVHVISWRKVLLLLPLNLAWIKR